MSELDNLVRMALIEDERQHRERLKLKKQRKSYLERGGITENTLISPAVYNYTISLRDEPVPISSVQDKDPDLRGTRGLYSIKYIPPVNTKYKKGLPFQIGQDLLRWRVVCSGYTMWKALAKTIPELGWIDRNSTLAPELFNIAKAHSGMTVWFTIDWVRYTQMVMEKANKKEIDIEHKPLVAYKCSQEDYDNLYKNKTLAEQKQYSDYMKEITAIQKEESLYGE